MAAKTPRDGIARLHESLIKALADPAMREKLAGRGDEPVGNTPDRFAAHLRDDMQR